jgi:hypothetical protein
VRFIARAGHHFLPLYEFDPMSGAWRHREARDPAPAFSLQEALHAAPAGKSSLPEPVRARAYARYLAEAGRLAAELAGDAPARAAAPPADFGALQFFST